MAGISSFARVKFSERNAVAYNSGTPFYQTLIESEHDDKIFGEGLLSVSVESFQTYLGIFQWE